MPARARVDEKGDARFFAERKKNQEIVFWLIPQLGQCTCQRNSILVLPASQSLEDKADVRDAQWEHRQAVQHHVPDEKIKLLLTS